MTTGRTLNKWSRIYGNGYDLSGHARALGSLPWEFEAPDLFTITDPIHNILLGKATIGPMAFNMILDSTAVSGSHTLLKNPTATWDLMVPIGIRAAPVMGDPVYMGKFPQTTYQATGDDEVITANVNFGIWDNVNRSAYHSPWGRLVAEYADRDGPNVALGMNDIPGAGPTTAGGYFMYQIFAYTTNGTCTISLDDSATNLNDASFAPMAGGTATTPAIAQTAIPCAGIIELAKTASVRKYVRWQLALAGMTHCWFAVAWCRGVAGLD